MHRFWEMFLYTSSLRTSEKGRPYSTTFSSLLSLGGPLSRRLFTGYYTILYGLKDLAFLRWK
jgi:hypothetical protein